MTPSQFLLLTVGVTAAAVAANMVSRRRRQRALAELARTWRMHYSPRDVFQLAQDVARRLPAPGAADVAVMDVVYGIEDDSYRFMFSVEYTLGVIQAKRRVVRVASFREPKGRTDPSAWSALQFAEIQPSLPEQYRMLHDQSIAPAT